MFLSCSLSTHSKSNFQTWNPHSSLLHLCLHASLLLAQSLVFHPPSSTFPRLLVSHGHHCSTAWGLYTCYCSSSGRKFVEFQDNFKAPFWKFQCISISSFCKEGYLCLWLPVVSAGSFLIARVLWDFGTFLHKPVPPKGYLCLWLPAVSAGGRGGA